MTKADPSTVRPSAVSAVTETVVATQFSNLCGGRKLLAGCVVLPASVTAPISVDKVADAGNERSTIMNNKMYNMMSLLLHRSQRRACNIYGAATFQTTAASS
jgi:hypothetical protein